MIITADLHIHSYLSRATSSQLNLEHLNQWAQIKGLQVVATGDFTHPKWLAELKQKLEPAEEGLYRLKDEFAAQTQREVFGACRGEVRFMLSTEISNIYKKKGQVRKIHNVVFVPDFESAEKLQEALAKIGNLAADGRPILGLDSRDLLELVLEVHPQAFLVPAHIWTPWFSILGSQSGFDSIEECFDDLTPHIFALETGLSSDPAMNWRLSHLDRFALISNSDAHSPAKLAREANVFNTELSYPAILEALKTKNPERFLGTIEFFPEEGKYHYDGHRKCGTRMAPRETLAYNGLCPVCGRPVTVGVMHRVESLADRKEGEKPPGALPFRSLIPLPEIIAEVQDVGVTAKSVDKVFSTLLSKLGPELEILQHVPLEEIEHLGGPILSEAIRRVREGKVQIAAGYDGEYGSIRLFNPEERKKFLSQMVFFQPAPTKSGQIPSKSGQAVPALEKPTPAKIKDYSAEAEYKVNKARTIVGQPAESGELAGLNPDQLRAVQHTEGPLLIVAGPGTGKTRTLTHRIAYLVRQKGVDPSQILAVTFTNKAAEEMVERLVRLLDSPTTQAMTIKTFHALGSLILRQQIHRLGYEPTFSIYGDSDALMVLRNLQPELSQKQLQELSEQISQAKNHLLSPEQCASLPEYASNGLFLESYQKYQTALKRYQALDYDDLIFLTVEIFQRFPEVLEKYRNQYRWISVDEYQDINHAQYQMLRLLTSGGANLCVIGDPDQAIYGFRGADRQYFFRFREDYPAATVIRLGQNYRSTATILDASGQVIARSPQREAVAIWSDIVSEGKVEICQAPTEKAEAEFVVHQIEKMMGGTGFFSVDSGRVSNGEQPVCQSFSDFAVLYRLGAQSLPLQEAFDRSGIPFQTVGEMPFFERREVKDLLSYLRVLQNPRAELDMLRLLNIPPRGLGEQTVVALQDFCREKKLSLREGLAQATFIPSLGHSTKEALKAFDSLLNELSLEIKTQTVTSLIVKVLQKTGLREYYGENEPREQMWQWLINFARPFENRLRDFLETAVLQKETDAYDPRAERVTLMTLHASKGLEFPVVFIVGCEENLLPYRREGADLEEERRLLYVGMTRAQKKLFLTHTKSRFLFGERVQNEPSRFLADIEEALKESRQTFQKPKSRTKEKEELQLKLF